MVDYIKEKLVKNETITKKLREYKRGEISETELISFLLDKIYLWFWADDGK